MALYVATVSSSSPPPVDTCKRASDGRRCPLANASPMARCDAPSDETGAAGGAVGAKGIVAGAAGADVAFGAKGVVP